ncbi:hypothetical protein [Pseudonocardia sp.]
MDLRRIVLAAITGAPVPAGTAAGHGFADGLLNPAFGNTCVNR